MHHQKPLSNFSKRLILFDLLFHTYEPPDYRRDSFSFRIDTFPRDSSSGAPLPNLRSAPAAGRTGPASTRRSRSRSSSSQPRASPASRCARRKRTLSTRRRRRRPQQRCRNQARLSSRAAPLPQQGTLMPSDFRAVGGVAVPTAVKPTVSAEQGVHLERPDGERAYCASVRRSGWVAQSIYRGRVK